MEDLLVVKNLKKYFPLQQGILENLLKYASKSLPLITSQRTSEPLLAETGRSVKAVDDISFYIKKGEVLGLAGESGCGKTTTGRLILRLLEPSAGDVTYRGQSIYLYGTEEMRKMREKLQVIFQDPNASLSPRMTIGYAVSHPLVIHNLYTPAERKERTLDILEKVGLSPAEFFYKKYPHQISGGQRQRVVIARALITNPELVVADEPIAMADVSVRATLLELMVKLKEEFHLTYLFITHDLATCKYICNRIAIMYLGKIVEIGPYRNVFGEPFHPYTKALLAAVPIPDPKFRRVEPIPKDEIPDAINPPSGCHFHPRCPYVLKHCSEQEPPLKDHGGGHFTACWLYEK